MDGKLIAAPNGQLSIIAPERRIISEPDPAGLAPADFLDQNLHSPERRLIELRMEHGDLDALIDGAGDEALVDELMVRRLKKRRLALRDQISRMELALDPKEPA